MPLTLVTGIGIPPSMPGYSAGSSLLNFNAGLYKLEEISMWSMARQPYQIIDDMFGRLIPSNEPFLVVYLSGSFQVQAIERTDPPDEQVHRQHRGDQFGHVRGPGVFARITRSGGLPGGWSVRSAW